MHNKMKCTCFLKFLSIDWVLLMEVDLDTNFVLLPNFDKVYLALPDV